MPPINGYTDQDFKKRKAEEIKPYHPSWWGGFARQAWNYGKYPAGLVGAGLLSKFAWDRVSPYLNEGNPLRKGAAWLGGMLPSWEQLTSDGLGTLTQGAQWAANQAGNLASAVKPHLATLQNSIGQMGSHLGTLAANVNSIFAPPPGHEAPVPPVTPAPPGGQAPAPPVPPPGGQAPVPPAVQPTVPPVGQVPTPPPSPQGQPQRQQVQSPASGGRVPRYPWGGGSYGLAGSLLGRRMQKDEMALGASMLGNPTAQNWLQRTTGNNWRNGLFNYMAYNMTPALAPFQSNPYTATAGLMGRINEGYNWLAPHIGKAGNLVMQGAANHPGAIGNYFGRWGSNLQGLTSPGMARPAAPAQAQSLFTPGAGFAPARAKGGTVPRYGGGGTGNPVNWLANSFMQGFNSTSGMSSAPDTAQSQINAPSGRTSGGPTLGNHALAMAPGTGTGGPGLYGPQTAPRAVPQVQPEVPATPTPVQTPAPDPVQAQPAPRSGTATIPPGTYPPTIGGGIGVIADNLGSVAAAAQNLQNIAHSGRDIYDTLTGNRQAQAIANNSPGPYQPPVQPQIQPGQEGAYYGSMLGNLALGAGSAYLAGKGPGGAIAAGSLAAAKPAVEYLAGQIGRGVQYGLPWLGNQARRGWNWVMPYLNPASPYDVRDRREYDFSGDAPSTTRRISNASCGRRVPRYAGGGPGAFSNFIYGIPSIGAGGALLGAGLGAGYENWWGDNMNPEYYRRMLTGAAGMGLLGSLYGGIGNVTRRRR